MYFRKSYEFTLTSPIPTGVFFTFPHSYFSLLLLKTLASNKINIYMLHPFLYLNSFRSITSILL